MANKDEAVIVVDGVKKDFVLPHEKNNSIKSGVVSAFRKKDKSSEVQHALKGISFDIKRGEFFGILGRNGSGKSTLLKILADIYQPSNGQVVTKGKKVPFIELGVGFNPELTGRENVYLNGALLGFSKKEIDERYDDIVQFAELERFMDQKLKNYSSGMQVRLAFSVATRAEADILLVDEVLAVGDADFQRKCYDFFRKLKKTDTTIVFVTHDMNAVRAFCDRAILIEKGVITSDGKASVVADEYLKLFSGETEASASEHKEKKSWGSGDITIEDASIDSTNSNITIKINLKAKQDIEEYVVGYNFKTSDDTVIMGGNNLNASAGAQKLTIAKDENKSISFSTINFLGTGEYSVELIVRDVNGTIFDKWSEFASIKVTKAESYYPIITPAKITVG